MHRRQPTPAITDPATVYHAGDVAASSATREAGRSLGESMARRFEALQRHEGRDSSEKEKEKEKEGGSQSKSVALFLVGLLAAFLLSPPTCC